MSAPILATKLFIPPPRPKMVARLHLIERLNEGLHQKLILISAPAGFGKTTLVSEWIHQKAEARETLAPAHSAGMNTSRESGETVQPFKAAWLSLDEGDNDPAHFLAYLVAALQIVAPTIGEGALAMLHAQPQPPTEALLTALLNEMTAIPENFILVLDDYHTIESKAIDHALNFLLDHQPPQMHLVIATREDPDLPLARYRVRGQLTELRASDLRFTPAEAAEFLNQMMGLNLSADDVAVLETRTEGWIAGLQLAALSMQGQKDAAGFIKSFTGSHRFVLDYLLEEVLGRQSESIQTFLLQTSILDRLCGPLCDAVLGKEEENGSSFTLHPSSFILDYLERANLFIIPLDNERHWYRYHRLFADLLRQRLPSAAASTESVVELHRRASLWYEENGYLAEAFHHAIAAEDFDRALGVAELAWQAMDRSFQSAVWLGWIKKLPDELIRMRPVLSMQYAQALMDAGEPEASESRLRDAEQWLEPRGEMNARLERSRAGMVILDEELFRTLPARIALTRAYNAHSQGNVSGAVKYAELALNLSPEEDYINHAGAAVFLGIAKWASGDLQAAQMAMADWVNVQKKANNIVFAVASSSYLAEIIVAQGRLHEAVRSYEQALQLALEHEKDVQQVTAHLYLGLAMLYHEMGNVEIVAQHLLRCRELSEKTTLPNWPYRWHLAQAQLKESEGDLEAALSLLDEAEQLFVRVPVPDIHPIEALKARVYVRQGRLTKAQDWVRERGLSADDELSYLGEFEHITLARLFIAEHKRDRTSRSIVKSMGLFARLLKAAEDGERLSSVIEILILQALAHQAQDDMLLALASLERALALAEPEGYVRIFVDEGLPMAALLQEAAKRSASPGYLNRLQAAFGKAEGETPVTQLLIEPLSERELEVLRLLKTELNGPEIARKLMVSLNTMRTHTKNIYNKLGVNNRRAAVRRAEELELL